MPRTYEIPKNKPQEDFNEFVNSKSINWFLYDYSLVPNTRVEVLINVGRREVKKS